MMKTRRGTDCPLVDYGRLIFFNGEQASEGDERPGMWIALFTRVFSVA